MYSYSSRSKSNLATADPLLKIIFLAVIVEINVSIIFGHRSKSQQLTLFNQGRTRNGSIITYSDGYNKKSDHNFLPSQAIDVVPFPSMYKNLAKFQELAVIVKRIAAEKGINIKWGGDWKSFKDYSHWYL